MRRSKWRPLLRVRWLGCGGRRDLEWGLGSVLQFAEGLQPAMAVPPPVCPCKQPLLPHAGMPAEAAWQLLLEFTAQEARGLAQPFLNSPANRRRLRDALLVGGNG